MEPGGRSVYNNLYLDCRAPARAPGNVPQQCKAEMPYSLRAAIYIIALDQAISCFMWQTVGVTAWPSSSKFDGAQCWDHHKIGINAYK